MIEKIKVLALFGESGSGKDTIQTWLLKNIPNTHKPITYTTRPARDYEINGKNYYFISNDEFKELKNNNKILESFYVKDRDWYYGSSIYEFQKNKINIIILTPTGIRNILNNNQLEVLPVYIKAPDKIRLLRSLDREENPDCTEICRRFLSDKEDFKNIGFLHETYNNISNNYEDILKSSIITTWLLLGNNN